MTTNLTDSQLIYDVFQKIFKKRKWLILASIFAVLIPVILYNEATSPVYEARTMVVFEEFNNPVEGYDYTFSREVFFSNQLVEIKSYSFALDIVKSLPPNIIEGFDSPDSGEPKKSGFDYIVAKVQKNIAAFPVRGSNIIEISFQSNKPVVCKEVADVAAEVLQKRNYEIKKEGVGGVRVFIEKQLARYKEQLDVSETELKVFKEKNNLTSVDREAEEIMRRLTDAEVLHNQVKTDIGSTKNRLVTLESKLAQQKSDLVPNITDVGSSWAQKLREKLVELNLQYVNLKVQGYPENHPKMIDLKEDMERIQNDLREKASKIAQSESALDPLAQMEKYVDDLITLQIDLEGLEAREKALRSIIGNYNRSLGTLPNKEFELAKLTRERDVSQKIYTMLLEKLEAARIAESEQIDPIRVIDKAQLPIYPISPRKKLNLAIGFLLGLIMGVAIAFVIELKNDTIKSTAEVERLTEWPVLAMIPDMNTFSRGKFKKINYPVVDRDEGNGRSYRALFSSLEPNTPIAEAYRMLRTNLQFAGLGREYKTLLVTSLAPGDGKTTTITNLAITFATFGDRTLIFDADLRIPVLHTFFGLERETGVTDLLEALGEMDSIMANPKAKELTVNKTLHQEVQEKLNINISAFDDNNHPDDEADSSDGETDLPQSKEPVEASESKEYSKKYVDIRELFEKAIKSTGIQNLSFVTSGRKLQHPEGLISTRPMPLILQKFKNRFNTMLIDSAPLLLVNDTLMLAGIVDGVILVVDSNKCSKEMLLKAKKLLSNSKANVVGIVLNKFEVASEYKAYYSNYYSEKV